MKPTDSWIAERYDTRRLVKISVEEGIVTQVEPLSAPPIPEQNGSDGISPHAPLPTGTYPLVAPGLFDLQINGGGGVEFSSGDLTVERTKHLFDLIYASGVTRCCPTLTTNDPAILIHAAAVIAETLRCYPEYRSLVVGIHLEGPFIAIGDGPRGAHPKHHVQTRYDFGLIERLENVSENRVRLITLSPEYPGATDFIRKLTTAGIVVALGHTDASPENIADAVAAGATLSTHLANGTYPQIPKAGNHFFAQLLDDRLTATLIADGFHLSPMMFETIRRIKGSERLILVSDLSGMAGLPPGRYSTDLCELEIQPNGRIVLGSDSRLLAGASTPLADGIATAAGISQLPWGKVFDWGTRHPAKLLGQRGFGNGSDDDFLAVGLPADFILGHFSPGKLGPRGIADTTAFVPGQFTLFSVPH